MSVQVEATRRYGTVSPLRYPGGKSALAGLFADLIAALGIRSRTYVRLVDARSSQGTRIGA